MKTRMVVLSLCAPWRSVQPLLLPLLLLLALITACNVGGERRCVRTRSRLVCAAVLCAGFARSKLC